jgi:hypothetical protein
LIPDRPYAQSRLEELYEDDPEGFPEAFGGGDAVFGFTEPSIKQQLRCRRLRLDQSDEVFTVGPASVMSYMSGRTDEVKQAFVPHALSGAVLGHCRGLRTRPDGGVSLRARSKPVQFGGKPDATGGSLNP